MASQRATTARPTSRRPAANGHVGAVEGLQGALNMTFQIYRDTHLAHFNVRGPAFPQLHTLLELQYNELWEAVDEIAERIRALGHLVTHGALALADSELPQDAGEMLGFLAAANSQATAQWQTLFDVAKAGEDHATADLCNARVRAHQKHAWMLGATAEPV
ncbi:MAG: starvation-inducible DNA-binding protein [Thermoplasmata archaeon]|jgi:starvation-inducible DNA-binding protein|nr:starvation-inducible DNA-binding protein [Thermoplasmata archaeon]